MTVEIIRMEYNKYSILLIIFTFIKKSLLGSRERFSPNEVMYGIIRKKDNISYFNTYENNPIESSYQLMWKELNSEEMSPITSFNTMRRILEYYFNIIGAWIMKMY